jgi:nucleotide-binding universal stress UspA family protein
MKTRNILVPIDFSGGSKKALRYAVHFAKDLNARIVLLHVVQPADDVYEDELTHRLRAWADEFVPGGIPVQTQMRTGSEAIEIVKEAKNPGVTLMIISTHGRTGRAHSLAGSLAENLVQLAPCPVLVVREYGRDFIESSSNVPAATDSVASAI